MDATLGELETVDNLTGRLFYGVKMLDEVIPGLRSGEVVLPGNFFQGKSDPVQIPVDIPYLPYEESLRLRLRQDQGHEHSQYVINPTNNSIWFPVMVEKQGFAPSAPALCRYALLCPEGRFTLVMRAGYLSLYSAAQTDMQIKASLHQNEVFLLKAFAGNLYQHPTTGVGLIEFLHGNFENSGLAARLQSEFSKDSMVVNNAYMDSLTGELLLDVTEKEDVDG